VNTVVTDVAAIASLLLPAQPDAACHTGFVDEKQDFVRSQNVICADSAGAIQHFRRHVASTLTFQLLTIGKDLWFVKGEIVKI
jgi:hypothetical protein